MSATTSAKLEAVRGGASTVGGGDADAPLDRTPAEGSEGNGRPAILSAVPRVVEDDSDA
jgi:hypothetical protein